MNLNGRDEVTERARRRFDAVPAEEGEGICIASLPLPAEEIVGEEQGACCGEIGKEFVRL